MEGQTGWNGNSYFTLGQFWMQIPKNQLRWDKHVLHAAHSHVPVAFAGGACTKSSTDQLHLNPSFGIPCFWRLKIWEILESSAILPINDAKVSLRMNGFAKLLSLAKLCSRLSGCFLYNGWTKKRHPTDLAAPRQRTFAQLWAAWLWLSTAALWAACCEPRLCHNNRWCPLRSHPSPIATTTATTTTTTTTLTRPTSVPNEPSCAIMA